MDNSPGIFPRFYMRIIEDPVASREMGRPIHKEVEYVEIRIAGDNKTVINKKVDDEHRRRWPNVYQAFKNQQQIAVEGTPIEEWPAITEARRKDLKALNIFNVEALAELPENGIQRLGMGARELVAKAKAWLDSAKSTSEIQKYAAENEKLNSRITYLEQQIQELLENDKRSQRQNVLLPEGNGQQPSFDAVHSS